MPLRSLSEPDYSRPGRNAPTACETSRWHNGREPKAEPFRAVDLKTYIVEDNATIRENLIGTLEELASVQSLGWAETESEARNWLARHGEAWDLAIIDLFLKQGSGLGVLEACNQRGRGQRVVVLS